MALIGYARVSTTEQDLAPQRDALVAAGCERVFEDRLSGARADRPGLARGLFAYLRSGDVCASCGSWIASASSVCTPSSRPCAMFSRDQHAQLNRAIDARRVRRPLDLSCIWRTRLNLSAISSVNVHELVSTLRRLEGDVAAESLSSPMKN